MLGFGLHTSRMKLRTVILTIQIQSLPGKMIDHFCGYDRILEPMYHFTGARSYILLVYHFTETSFYWNNFVKVSVSFLSVSFYD